MPEEGVELSPKENILTDDEVVRIARIFVKSGVDKIRLTGGEPTVRKGIVELTGMLIWPRDRFLPSACKLTYNPKGDSTNFGHTV
jgi:molybdenum cofactor biosynthesis enzyme MoaA